jgi:Proprotein convertase P-domain
MLALVAAVTLSLHLERVQESLTGTHYTYRQYAGGVPLLGPGVRAGKVALYVDGKLHIAKQSIVYERPLEPYAEYRDAETGELLRREALFWTAKARVFDVNPVAKLNDPTLQDHNNAADAVPDAAYSVVDLDNLAPSGMLAGPNVTIVDTEAPFTEHADASQPLLFDRSQPQFEEVNAYYAIDRTQRYIESLGYTGARKIVAYAIPVDAHAAGGSDNSYYISSATPGRGALYFGDGGTDDAEDPDIMLHEFMHAVQDWIAPGAFGGSPQDQSRAMAEGYADYWAFSENYAGTIASGRDPFCIADWDARCWQDDSSQECGYPAGSDCLRRVDSAKTMADYVVSNISGTEHKNGEIWSSALREIFLRAGKRTTDQMVIESYFGTPPSPTFRVMAQKLIDADRLLTGGVNAATICAAMTARGILGSGECDRAPRGEVTYVQSSTSTITITDPRAIERLFVHVRASHPARGELRVTLIAPDGTPVVLQQPSADQTPDLDVTYTVDALRGRSAAGVWQLVLEDVIPQINAGSLTSWDLGIQFAGDTPLTSRPLASSALHVAVAGHLPQFRTDLRILNRGATTANVLLLFTPDASPASFAAVHVAIEPGHVVAYDDVVSQLFQTVGAGAIELQGDIADLVVTSNGTPAQPTSAATSGPLIAPWAEVDDAFRTSYGFTEVAGGNGIVRVTALDARTGALLLSEERAVAPFTHNQFPLLGIRGEAVLIFTATGTARLLAYASVVDNASGDAMYVPATPPPAARTAYAPAIDSVWWHTDVRVTAPATPVQFGTTTVSIPTVVRDILPTAFGTHNAFGLLTAQLAAGEYAATRTWTGHYGEFIPFLDTPMTSGDIIGIESSTNARTNLGIFSPSAAHVQLTVYDSAGTAIHSLAVEVLPLQLTQFTLPTPIINGRLRIESSAPVFVYASRIANTTGAPTLLLPQC